MAYRGVEEVVLALVFCGFPIDLPSKMVGEVLRGGVEKVAEVTSALAGGYTVIDNESKYGLAVMGLVHPDLSAIRRAVLLTCRAVQSAP